MNMIKTIAAAGGLAAASMMAMPAEAEAQYAPGYNQGGDIIGAIIRGVLGSGNYGQYPYGNYGYNQRYQMDARYAVDRCTAAVEARLNNTYQNNRYTNGRYNRYDPRAQTRYPQYNPRYQNNRYDPRYQDNRYNPRYDNRYQNQARVAGITDVKNKGNGLRVYGVAMSGQYAAQYNRYGQRGYGYNQRPDLKFKCQVDRNGRISDIDVNRYNGR